jgi:N-acetylglutamate synthase-like GNAT family acetyltransferase
MGLDETAFRSRDYVIAVDEDTNTRAGFGRSRVHKTEADEELCELTSIGVLEGWRGEGVGAHVVERLLDKASDQGFETVYALTSTHGYLAQFGFEPMEPDDLPPKLQDRLAAKREELDPEAIPMRIDADAFEMPDDLRERFKPAGEPRPEEEDPEETAEDFGIDPDEATYKYDTGR